MITRNVELKDKKNKNAILLNVLNKYIQQCYHSVYKSRIQNNPLYFLSIREIYQINDLRNVYQTIVVQSINHIIENSITYYEPNTLVKLIPAFDIVSASNLPNYIYNYLNKVKYADPNLLDQYSKNIQYLIYKISYFANDRFEEFNTSLVALQELSNYILDKTKVLNKFKGLDSLYNTSIDIENNENELTFIIFLNRVIRKANYSPIKFYISNRYLKNSDEINFPISEIINYDDTSRLSATKNIMLYNFDNPDFWNYLSTLSVQWFKKLRSNDTKFDCSLFYCLAITKKKNMLFKDLKYEFNFIEAKSKFLSSNQILDSEFIYDSLYFLSQYSSKKFNYYIDRTEIFANYIIHYKDDIDIQFKKYNILPSLKAYIINEL